MFVDVCWVCSSPTVLPQVFRTIACMPRAARELNAVKSQSSQDCNFAVSALYMSICMHSSSHFAYFAVLFGVLDPDPFQ